MPPDFHIVRTLRAFAIILLLTAPLTSGASSGPLAGYEPSEAADLSMRPGPNDPGLNVTWPVEGGVAGAPPATEGMYVLKMEWTNEIDRKVEVRHDWNGPTFDLPGFLAGVAEIQVDVYVETSSALPQIAGIWDDVFGWTGGCSVPLITHSWTTVSMNVGHLQHFGLDHIFALLFENLAGDNGVIYIDNLRLVSTRQISFAGRDWIVKSGNHLGPGPNDFSQSEENVWVDSNGRLHLKIAQRCGRWFCSEIVACDSLGYGAYFFTVESRLDSLNVNEVLGLFTWDDAAPQYHYREIDFEFGRWGDPENDNAQYVVQPWDTSGNMHRFNVEYPGPLETTTHAMIWGSDAIEFTSYHGGFCSVPTAANLIANWWYGGSDNPPPGGENMRMNFWLLPGGGPSSGQDAEVVISDFRYSPEVSPDTDGDGLRDVCDSCPAYPNPDQEFNCSDFDTDCDVDGFDFLTFANCYNGSERPPLSACENPAADLEADGDVDGFDFLTFANCYNGSERAPLCP